MLPHEFRSNPIWQSLRSARIRPPSQSESLGRLEVAADSAVRGLRQAVIGPQPRVSAKRQLSHPPSSPDWPMRGNAYTPMQP